MREGFVRTEDGKVIGTLRDGVLIKMGKQVQYFVILKGWGTAKWVLDDPAVERVRLHLKTKVVEATVDDFQAHGIRNLYTDEEVFEEEQLVLPEEFWHVRANA